MDLFKAFLGNILMWFCSAHGRWWTFPKPLQEIIQNKSFPRHAGKQARQTNPSDRISFSV